MTRDRWWWAVAAVTVACGADVTPNGEATATDPALPPAFEPPIVVNAETPVRYPLELYREQTEGTVILRLFVDETGAVVADSTRIAEGSGHPSLDSAALAAVPAMAFAPARRNGAPVATVFLQPVHFRHPEGGGSSGGF